MDPPTDFAAYALSDTQIGLRFMKPINDDYDYWLLYKIATDPLYIPSGYWATYGPFWSDSIIRLKPDTNYRVRVRLACTYNSSIESPPESDATKTFAKRKQSLAVIFFSPCPTDKPFFIF